MATRILPRKDASSRLNLGIETRLRYLAPPYDALSYTWGGPECSQEILLNGESFVVRQNLYNALLRLESLTELREGTPGEHLYAGTYLWIDAICIDQGDQRERAEQVKHMNTIFSCARKVFAWLGVAALDRQICHGASAPPDGHQIPLQPPRRHVYKPFRAQSSSPGAKSDHSHSSSALLGLLERPYWRRMWVVQEIRVAREVCLLWEEGWMPLQSFVQCFEISEFENEFANRFSYLLPRAERFRYLRNEENTLCSLLGECILCCCQDPRDRVYALLGMLRPEDQKWFHLVEKLPDYSISYEDVIRKVISQLTSWWQFGYGLPPWASSDLLCGLGLSTEVADQLLADIRLCVAMADANKKRTYDWSYILSLFSDHRRRDWSLVIGPGLGSGRKQLQAVMCALRACLYAQTPSQSVICSDGQQAAPTSAGSPTERSVVLAIWDCLTESFESSSSAFRPLRVSGIETRHGAGLHELQSARAFHHPTGMSCSFDPRATSQSGAFANFVRPERRTTVRNLAELGRKKVSRDYAPLNSQRSADSSEADEHGEAQSALPTSYDHRTRKAMEQVSARPVQGLSKDVDDSAVDSADSSVADFIRELGEMEKRARGVAARNVDKRGSQSSLTEDVAALNLTIAHDLDGERSAAITIAKRKIWNA